MGDIALAAVGAAHDSTIEEEQFLRIEARLVVDVDMAREVRRLATVGPPLVATPRARLGEEKLSVES